jgi:hypothetical protein
LASEPLAAFRSPVELVRFRDEFTSPANIV